MRARRLSLALILSVCAVAPTLAGPARADAGDVSETDKAQARRLVALGDEKMAQGDYRGAYDAYRGADTLMSVPTTGLQVGRAELAMGRLLEARATLDRVAGSPAARDEPSAFTAARRQAAELRQTLEDRIPQLSVRVAGVPAGKQPLVSVDGTAWSAAQLSAPQSMNPGEHEVSAWVEGRQQVSRHVVLAERDRQVVQLVVPTPPAAHSTGLSPLVPIGFGAAGLGLVVGIVTGVLSLNRAADVKKGCYDERICPRSLEGARDASLAFAHVSTGSFIFAGAGLVVGVIGLVIGGPERTTKGAGVRPGGHRPEF